MKLICIFCTVFVIYLQKFDLMKTITIKVDDRTKRGKTFIDMLEIFSKEREIEILKTPQTKDKTAFLEALNLSEDEK